MEKFYSCTLQFPTRYADFNFQDRLKLSSILNFMQEAAGISGNELGCGSHYLWPRGLGFILTHNYLELYKDVEPEELLTVKTFPLQPKHVVIERQYEFYNPAGEKLAAATSRWCVIDFKQNKFLPISALEGQDFSRYTSEKSIDFNALIQKRYDGYIYAVPTTASEAYAIMMHKMLMRYEDAEIYCMIPCQRKDGSNEVVENRLKFYDAISKIANRFGLYCTSNLGSFSVLPAGSRESSQLAGCRASVPMEIASRSSSSAIPKET